jgi:dimethylamine corrinoid protein
LQNLNLDKDFSCKYRKTIYIIFIEFIRRVNSLAKQEILDALANAVIEMDEEEAKAKAQAALDENIAAYEAITDGLVKGMQVVGDKYEQEEYFIPEVLICSDAMNAGLEILQPHLPKESDGTAEKVVIGVVEGDTHDIGKNLVRIMMEAGGFEAYDLGRNVPLMQFVDKAEEVGASVVAMATLMTTTMDGMGTVVEELKKRGLRDKITVIIGGGPISQAFADEIGADLYASDANVAVRKLKNRKEQ